MSGKSLVSMALIMAAALLVGAFSPLYLAWFFYVGVAGWTAYLSLRNYVVPAFRFYSVVCLLFTVMRTVETFAILDPLVPIVRLLALLSAFLITVKVVRLRIRFVQIETVFELVGLACVSGLAVILGFSLNGTYSSQLWETMIPITTFVVAVAAILGRKTDITSRLLIASTLSPLFSAVTDFEKTESAVLSIAALPYISIAAAVGLRQPFEAVETRLRRRFGKWQLILLLLMVLLPSVAFVQAIATSSDLRFAIASIVIGVIGSTSMVLRVALLIRGRDWTYEQEKNLAALNDRLVLTESEDEIFVEVLEVLDEFVGRKCVVGIGHNDPSYFSTTYEKGSVKKVKSSISVPVPGNPGLFLYAKSWRHFRIEVEELFSKTANQMHLVIDRQAVREESLRNLRYQATHDQLTGLLNRSAFMDVAQDHLAAASSNVDGAILFIDIDRFKFVNDTYGHAIGDKLLVSVADRLVSSVRSEDVVARVGGDEFVILLKKSEYVDAVVSRIQRSVSDISLIDDCEISVSPSTGFAYLQPFVGVEQIVKQADTAMYQNKRDKALNLGEINTV